MKQKSIAVQFTVMTFGIAYGVSGILILLGRFGYRVYNWVDTLPQFAMNIPFAIYILSPAIASYIILRRNGMTANVREWLKTVFYAKNNVYPYLFVIAGLTFYFLMHGVMAGGINMALPFYTFFLSLPGNLIIGGLEEAGWSYVLQPSLRKKYGYIISSLWMGVIWVFWHIPLFLIPGTSHGEGLIDFWMFNVQVMSLRFFFGAIYKISGKSGVFMCVLFHTMFNAVSPVFGTMTTTWGGTILANSMIVLVSIITVAIYKKHASQRVEN